MEELPVATSPPAPDADVAPVADVANDAPPRGPLRRFLEARGSIGGLHAAHRRVRLHAADGVWLSAVLAPGPSAAAPASRVAGLVLAHGFGASAAKPAYARLADELSRSAAVLSLDLRGHGRSEGACTFGDLERHDVDAGIAALQARGHSTVVVLGVSMGSTAALHALATGARANALVTISGPGYVRTAPGGGPLGQLDRRLRSGVGRAAMRSLFGLTVEHPSRWRDPIHPVDLAREVAVDHLVVHGRDDAWFPDADARALAAHGATLWLEEDFGHAEDGLQPAFLRRLRAAVDDVAAGRGFGPDRIGGSPW